jgi:hypothetical protein
MVRRWSTTRSWLVFWELLALLAFAVAVNRFYRAAPVSYDVGVTPMGWETLMDLISAAAVSAVCAVVGLVPAAWVSLGRARAGAEPPNPASSGPTASSANAGESLPT